MKKPRVSRELRESEIIEAAMRCVLRAGFHGTSMDNIAREAGFSVGVIYRYFANKEAVIEAIVARDIANIQTAIESSHAKSDENVAQAMVANAAKMLAGQHSHDQRLLRLEIYAEAARNPKIKAIVAKFAPMERDLLYSLLKRSTRGLVADAELYARADLFRMMADGMIVHGLYHLPENEPALVAQLQKLIAHITN